jgi:hypothetical protein
MHNWSNWCHYCTSSLNKVASEFSQRTHPIHSIAPKTHTLGHFGPFRYCTKVDTKLSNWCHYHRSSLNKVASEFFATNAPDPLHWTQNSCLEAFQNVSLLHQSRCKTGRTGAVIVQVRQNKVASEFFATSAPDPLHWTQNSCLEAFQNVSLLHESRCKTGRTGAITAQAG